MIRSGPPGGECTTSTCLWKASQTVWLFEGIPEDGDQAASAHPISTVTRIGARSSLCVGMRSSRKRLTLVWGQAHMIGCGRLCSWVCHSPQVTRAAMGPETCRSVSSARELHDRLSPTMCLVDVGRASAPHLVRHESGAKSGGAALGHGAEQV